MEEKQLSDCTNVLIQLVDAYGEDEAYEKILNLLPKTEEENLLSKAYAEMVVKWGEAISRFIEIHGSISALLEVHPKLPAKYVKAIEEAQSSVPEEVSSDV